MIPPVGRILLKVFELLGCIACVVTKALTDLESGRVFLRNQKLSREWGLLHNLFWSSSGNAFANVTYGGFTLIIALMLISRIIDSKSRPSLVEKIFLTVGMLCFFAMGGLVFAAFDQVPSDLHDNAIILGCLSFFVALLFLFDLADPMARHTSDTTQTENMVHNNGHIIASPTDASPLKTPNGGIENKQINRLTTPQQTDTSVQVHDIHEDSRSENHSPDRNIALNGTYHRSDEVDFVQTKILPRVEQPVFEKVLLPEKRRPKIQNIPNPRENTSQTEFVREQVVDTRKMQDERQSADDQKQTAYDQKQNSYDQRHNAYDQKQTAYDQRQNAYDQRQNAYDQKQTVYDQRQNTYDQRQFAHDQKQTSYNQRQNSYDQKVIKKDLTSGRSTATSHDHRHSPYDQNNFNHQDKYHSNIDYRYEPHHNYGYVRDNSHTPRKLSSNQHLHLPYDRYGDKPLMVVRDYSNLKANMSYEQRIKSPSYRRNNNNNFNHSVSSKSHCKSHCSSDDEENISAVQPGFVATVAKIWDTRAKRDLNTVV